MPNPTLLIRALRALNEPQRPLPADVASWLLRGLGLYFLVGKPVADTLGLTDVARSEALREERNRRLREAARYTSVENLARRIRSFQRRGHPEPTYTTDVVGRHIFAAWLLDGDLPGTRQLRRILSR